MTFPGVVRRNALDVAPYQPAQPFVVEWRANATWLKLHAEDQPIYVRLGDRLTAEYGSDEIRFLGIERRATRIESNLIRLKIALVRVRWLARRIRFMAWAPGYREPAIAPEQPDPNSAVVIGPAISNRRRYKSC